MDHSLIENLKNPDLYDHPVDGFAVIETHLSWVLLTGSYAYKIKKPVDLGFVDFSTLEKRRHFCEEELRLNQSLAKNIYLKVLPIHGSPDQPSFKPLGPVIEYAIQMLEFDQSQLLSKLQHQGKLTSPVIESIAKQLALFHQQAEVCDAEASFGGFNAISEPALDNFRHCRELLTDRTFLKPLETLRLWTCEALQQHRELIIERKAQGFIRNCHGDVHLDNIALIDNVPTIFDCIEFNPNFHWIDVVNEIAFLGMDLLSRREDFLANQLINVYLQITGDYTGMQLYRFYLIYRALVRAKVALLTDLNDALGLFPHYLQLAESLTQRETPKLILLHGLSGSGKSHIVKQLTPCLNAIWLRSDIERKRLAKASNIALSTANLYNNPMTETTYQHLADRSLELLQSGFSVLVDAAFLQRSQREIFLKLAQKECVIFGILECCAEEITLSQRIKARQREGTDPSDATLEVLQQQIKQLEPLTPREQEFSIRCDTTQGWNLDQLMEALLQLPVLKK